MSPYILYLLRCSDGTYYAGITTDVTRRLHEHNDTVRGARYTSGRRPVTLVYQEQCPDRRSALRRELEIKKLSRAEKERLIALAAA